MRSSWSLAAILIILLTITSIAIVASRLFTLEAHRAYKREERRMDKLQEEEHTLRIEWISRTDLNTIENRARTELGMYPPKPEQWRIVSP
ncbi:cell division protein FtsL [Magnetococcales bacterium HHB-1]